MASHDLNQVHHAFASGCFNRTWELLDKPARTPEEDEHMVLLAHTSLWHWTQRADCTAMNLNIGYWQLARVYAVLQQADNARRAALVALRYSEGTEPFYVAYAHEALARAARVAGDAATAAQHLAEARLQAAQVSDEDSRAMLEKDLATLAE